MPKVVYLALSSDGLNFRMHCVDGHGNRMVSGTLLNIWHDGEFEFETDVYFAAPFKMDHEQRAISTEGR